MKAPDVLRVGYDAVGYRELRESSLRVAAERDGTWASKRVPQPTRIVDVARVGESVADRRSRVGERAAQEVSRRTRERQERRVRVGARLAGRRVEVAQLVADVAEQQELWVPRSRVRRRHQVEDRGLADVCQLDDAFDLRVQRRRPLVKLLQLERAQPHVAVGPVDQRQFLEQRVGVLAAFGVDAPVRRQVAVDVDDEGAEPGEQGLDGPPRGVVQLRDATAQGGVDALSPVPAVEDQVRRPAGSIPRDRPEVLVQRVRDRGSLVHSDDAARVVAFVEKFFQGLGERRLTAAVRAL